jgi:hypothetical protein
MTLAPQFACCCYSLPKSKPNYLKNCRPGNPTFLADNVSRATISISTVLHGQYSKHAMGWTIWASNPDRGK